MNTTKYPSKVSPWRSHRRRTGLLQSVLFPVLGSLLLFSTGCLNDPEEDNNSAAGPSGKVRKVSKAGGSVTDLATGLDGPAGLVLDSGGTLYFTEIKTGKIKAVPKTGGTVTTIAAALMNPYDLLLEEVAGSKVLYFTEFNPTIGKIEKACLICPIGLLGDVDSLATNQPGSISLTLDDLDNPNVYYLNREGRQVMRLLKDSSDPQIPVVLVSSDLLNEPQDIVRVGMILYFTVADASGSGSLRCVPTTGGVFVTTIASGLNQPGALETDGENLYFVEVAPGTSGGMITTVPASCVPGAPLAVLDSGLSEPIGLTVDATHVYYTERAADRIWKVLKDGSETPILLADGLNLPFRLIVDDAIYFTETGTIF